MTISLELEEKFLSNFIIKIKFKWVKEIKESKTLKK